MAGLDAGGAPKRQCHDKSGADSDEGEQIIFTADAAQALEELATIQDANSIKEHDKTDHADGAGNLRVRGNRTEEEPNKEDCTDAKGEAQDVDLSDRVTQPDRKEQGEDRLRAKQTTDHLKHVDVLDCYRTRQPALRNISIAAATCSGVGVGVCANA